MFRRTCGDYARVLFCFYTRGYGCAKHPAFPAPSVLMREPTRCMTRADLRRGNAKTRHCEERKRRSNPVFAKFEDLDCFASLAMTVKRSKLL
jgi:hypothetical protein